MRFCQSDGTPLVDDAPPIDPYKTMVASSGDIGAAMPPAGSDAPVAEPPKEDEVLQLPADPDPLKTMYASEEEIRKEMNARDAVEEPVMDIPPLAPEPPKFSEPSLIPPSFGDVVPPPSPFAPAGGSGSDTPVESPFSKTTPPIPSPFTDPKPSTYEPPAPAAPNFPQFQDPEPVVSNAAPSPFDPPASSTPAWTPPPPAIEPSSHQQEPMQNSPYTPSPAAGGPSQTLAIVSLVAGILGLTVCCGALVPSLVAVVLGFMARGKANSDPANYGGAGLALGGLITGVIGVIGSIIVLIYVLLNFAFFAAMLANQ